MSEKRTKASCRTALDYMLPFLRGDFPWLSRIFNEMDALEPEQKQEVQVFRLFWGLTEREPISVGEIGDELGVDRETVHQYLRSTRSRLLQPMWQSDTYKHLRDP